VEWPEIKLPKCEKAFGCRVLSGAAGRAYSAPSDPLTGLEGRGWVEMEGKGQGMERRERKGCRREVVRKKRYGKREEGRGQKRQGKGLSPSNIVPPLVKTIAFNY